MSECLILTHIFLEDLQKPIAMNVFANSFILLTILSFYALLIAKMHHIC
ncbi:hypothetical protein Krac_9534 [Ktedonobacter racemifer DSM 44963]|uniref:Uncharacterized protein n=1 Tax=Ktedonobacter racemifer DSM 44963 TaxID=485913 RepID=D6TCM0_KTERA|nr:hypothetical protein Krac_9534 [Ktedonobacter racemifer DSM 44963]